MKISHEEGVGASFDSNPEILAILEKADPELKDLYTEINDISTQRKIERSDLDKITRSVKKLTASNSECSEFLSDLIKASAFSSSKVIKAIRIGLGEKLGRQTKENSSNKGSDTDETKPAELASTPESEPAEESVAGPKEDPLTPPKQPEPEPNTNPEPKKEGEGGFEFAPITKIDDVLSITESLSKKDVDISPEDAEKVHVAIREFLLKLNTQIQDKQHLDTLENVQAKLALVDDVKTKSYQILAQFNKVIDDKKYPHRVVSVLFRRMRDEELRHEDGFLNAIENQRKELKDLIPQDEKKNNDPKKPAEPNKDKKKEPIKKDTRTEDLQELFETIKEKTAPAGKDIENANIFLASEKNRKSSNESLDERVYSLTNVYTAAYKEIYDVVGLTKLTDIPKEDFFKLINYISTYILGQARKLKKNIGYIKDVARNETPQTPVFVEFAEALLDDSDFYRLTENILREIETLERFAKAKKIRDLRNKDDMSDEEFNGTEEKAKKGPDSKKDNPADKAKETEKGAEKKDEVGGKDTRSIDDLFTTPDTEDFTPNSEMLTDTGFDAWIKENYNYLKNETPKDQYASVIQKRPIEEYFELYLKQKETLTAIKQKIKDGYFDGDIPHAKENVEAARDFFYAKIQKNAFVYENVDNVKHLLDIIHKADAQKAIIAKLESDVQTALNGRDPQTVLDSKKVYEAIDDQNPEFAAFREYQFFFEDMQKNKDLYAGKSTAQILKLHNMLYSKNKKALEPEDGVSSDYAAPEVIEPGKVGRMWLKVKTFFPKKQNFNEVKAFDSKCRVFIDQNLSPRVNQLSKAQQEKNINALNNYLSLVGTAVANNKPIEGIQIDETNSDAVLGKHLFDSTFKPFVEKRAQDTEMQQKAKHYFEQRGLSGTIDEKLVEMQDAAELNASAEETNRQYFVNRTQGFAPEYFEAEAQAFIAERLLQETGKEIAALTKVPITPGTSHEDFEKTAIKFEKAKELLDKTTLKKEDLQMLYKTTLLRFTELLTKFSSLSPKLEKLLVQETRIYEEIAIDPNLTLKQKNEYFDALISTFKKKADGNKTLAAKRQYMAVIQHIEASKKLINSKK